MQRITLRHNPTVDIIKKKYCNCKVKNFRRISLKDVYVSIVRSRDTLSPAAVF